MTRPSDGRRGKGGGWVREMGEGEVEGGRGILPVVIRHHPLYPAVTRCHPLSPVAARRHPLLPVVTRCDPSSTVVIRRQTRHPAPMARLACCLGGFLISGGLASLASRSRWHVLLVVLGASCLGFLLPCYVLRVVLGASCLGFLPPCYVLRVVLGASCLGFLPPLLRGFDGTSCVLSWRLPAWASCLPCLAESKLDRRANIYDFAL